MTEQDWMESLRVEVQLHEDEMRAFLARRPQLDRLFDRVENTFLRLLDERRGKLGEDAPRPTVTRYHQHAVEIMFQWKGQDSIDRNVRACLEGIEGGQMTVEVNAWRDKEETDMSGVRISYGEAITSVPPPYRALSLRRVLDRAYLEVSGWDESRLVRTSSLTPLPHLAHKS